jgi:hypothetical protein
VPRILLLCSREAVFHPPALHEIIVRNRGDIVGVAVFEDPQRTTLAASIRDAISLDGWRAVPRLGRRWLAHRWNCIRHSPPHFTSVETLFVSHDLVPAFFKNPNLPESLAFVASLRPDVILNIQPWYLREPMLRSAQLACLNVHTAALPKYRGVQPVVRAFLADDSTIGVSIHTMTPEIDAGEVVAQRLLPRRASVFDSYKATFAVVPDLVGEAIDAIKTGKIIAKVSASDAYWGKLSADERATFRRRGLRYF